MFLQTVMKEQTVVVSRQYLVIVTAMEELVLQKFESEIMIVSLPLDT